LKGEIYLLSLEIKEAIILMGTPLWAKLSPTAYPVISSGNELGLSGAMIVIGSAKREKMKKNLISE